MTRYDIGPSGRDIICCSSAADKVKSGRRFLEVGWSTLVGRTRTRTFLLLSGMRAAGGGLFYKRVNLDHDLARLTRGEEKEEAKGD